MLRSPKVVYVCDHIISEIINDTILNEYTKSNSGIDLICDDGIISRINSVYGEDEEGNPVVYYNIINYEVYDKVNIKWIDGAPSTGENFTVNYTNTKRETKQYEPANCPRCSGFGWYVSLFNERSTLAEEVTGSQKLIQGFLKILLTKKLKNYGSTLHNVVGENISNRSILETNIIEAVIDCERQYKEYQLTNVEESNLSSSERLKSANVTNIEFDVEEGAIFITVILQNEQGSGSQLNLMI